ncbi:hypothetical protein EDB92DRAFT_1866235 [Lactarius akahatsu]|uniref:Uncharacterized protein n=1 Tax=Lactarius akahatsu TaxID=416441 RepID=A0AAD4LJS8_9AGAM|nr:hypothetical protein EDB92DRAFT_1866235 [Lactarius akahatsu]
MRAKSIASLLLTIFTVCKVWCIVLFIFTTIVSVLAKQLVRFFNHCHNFDGCNVCMIAAPQHVSRTFVTLQ